MKDDYLSELESAIDARASAEADWAALFSRINAAVAGSLAQLRAGTSNGYRATATAGAAWWDYTARAGLAAVPIGLAAAVLLFAYLRQGGGSAQAVVARVAIAASSADIARDAFDSVLTGSAAPRSVIGALLPAPSAAFLGDSSGGARR